MFQDQQTDQTSSLNKQRRETFNDQKNSSLSSSPDFKKSCPKSINKSFENDDNSNDFSSYDSEKKFQKFQNKSKFVQQEQILNSFSKNKLIQMVIYFKNRCQQMAKFYDQKDQKKRKTIYQQRKSLNKLQTSLNSFQEIFSQKFDSSVNLNNTRDNQKKKEKQNKALPIIEIEDKEFANQLISQRKTYQSNNNLKQILIEENKLRRISSLNVNQLQKDSQLEQMIIKFEKQVKVFHSKFEKKIDESFNKNFNLKTKSTSLALIYLILKEVKQSDRDQRLNIPKLLVNLVGYILKNFNKKSSTLNDMSQKEVS